jgi:hypothetical protein
MLSPMCIIELSKARLNNLCKVTQKREETCFMYTLAPGPHSKPNWGWVDYWGKVLVSKNNENMKTSSLISAPIF